MSKLRKYLLWFLLTAAHSWMFFHEGMGFNTLIFAMMTVIAVAASNELWKRTHWWLAAAGHIVASIGVAWHGSLEAIAMYYFSWFLLLGLSFADNTVAVAVINGVISSFTAVFAGTPQFISDLRHTSVLHHFFLLFEKRRAYLYAAPVTVTFVFYMLYCAVNPDFLLSISFPDWSLDMELILYTSFGMAILCPLFFPWGISSFSEVESTVPDKLERQKRSKGNGSLLFENRQGVVMFAMLNILICVFLVFNLLQIFIPSLRADVVTHSQQVHEGFWAVLVSIVVAIALIMYYFRGNQNFLTRNKLLLKAATVWIILNAALVLFTIYRNALYVNSYGLTYKRIWVFIGMILTIAGLVLTLIKVFRIRTNWYLIRRNSWVLYGVLAMYTLADWDRFIAWYNPNYAQELDLNYILSLGESKLPYLKTLRDLHDQRVAAKGAEIDLMIGEAEFNSESWKSRTFDKIWLAESLKGKPGK